jgi:uncharacterized protein YoxC
MIVALTGSAVAVALIVLVFFVSNVVRERKS